MIAACNLRCYVGRAACRAPRPLECACSAKLLPPRTLVHRTGTGLPRSPAAIGVRVHGQHRLTCSSSLLDQAWGTHVNAQELATNIFSTSIVPYSAFLYWLTKSRKTPPLALFGFYFLLVFVFATIPAGVVALKVYHKSLANVDILHGSAESMLTVTNLLIVLGLRQGVRQAEHTNAQLSERQDAAKSQPVTDAAKQQ